MIVEADAASPSARARSGKCCGSLSRASHRIVSLFLVIVALAGMYRIKKNALSDAIALSSDLRGPFISARAWMRGLNPYDPEVQEEQWRQIRGPADEDLKAVHFFDWTPSLYPPPTLAVLAPLTLLPWPVVRIEWLLQNLLLSILAYLALCDMLRLPLGNWRAQLFGRDLAFPGALRRLPPSFQSYWYGGIA